MSDDLKRKVDRYQARVPDPTLAGLAEVFAGEANGDRGLGVTLIVGGSIISGVTVSEAAWAEAIGQQPGNFSEVLSEQMVKVADGRGQKPELSDDEYEALDEEQRVERLVQWSSSFLHLVDAQQLVGEFFVPERGVPMRIRLSEIQGWSMGKLAKDAG